MIVKISGTDGSSNLGRRLIFQGKKVVGGSVQLCIWAGKSFCKEHHELYIQVLISSIDM